MNEELRASDHERELAVARLRDASAEGRLTLDELMERSETAYTARTHGELVRVTADLPEQPSPRPARTGRTRFVVAIFAPVHRRNRWKLVRLLLFFTLSLTTFLDLGNPSLEEDEATITVLSIF